MKSARGGADGAIGRLLTDAEWEKIRPLYFALGVLGCNLGQLLKRQVLPASYRAVTVATLRRKVYRLAGNLLGQACGCMLQIKAELEKWLLLRSARLSCVTLQT